jgi:hypothetical protein
VWKNDDSSSSSSMTMGDDALAVFCPCTHSIVSGCAGGLELALRATEQVKVDVGLPAEAKLTGGINRIRAGIPQRLTH